VSSVPGWATTRARRPRPIARPKRAASADVRDEQRRLDGGVARRDRRRDRSQRRPAMTRKKPSHGQCRGSATTALFPAGGWVGAAGPSRDDAITARRLVLSRGPSRRPWLTRRRRIDPSQAWDKSLVSRRLWSLDHAPHERESGEKTLAMCSRRPVCRLTAVPEVKRS
jgi:hypothetical protein